MNEIAIFIFGLLSGFGITILSIFTGWKLHALGDKTTNPLQKLSNMTPKDKNPPKISKGINLDEKASLNWR